MKPLRVLMLVADPERRNHLSAMLRQSDHRVEAVPDAASLAEALREPGADALLLDLRGADIDVGALRQALSPTEALQPDSLQAAERRHLAQVLRFTDGNKRQAALLLGISRSTLQNKVRKYALLLLAVLASLRAGPLEAQSSGPMQAGRVTSGSLSFDGHATVGDFVGRTTTVSGEFSGGPELSAVRGWVQAPVRSLSTGNGRRDKDLNKSMESARYPDIRFELSGVTRKSGSEDSAAVTLHGMLQIHGVTKEVSLPAVVELTDSGALVRSDFPLSLKEYRVGGLSKMLGMLKMYDNIEVHVDLLFGPAQASSNRQGTIRTLPRRDTTTARVAVPRLTRSVALESPRENPSGEKVKARSEPASDTPRWAGPASDQRGVLMPRGRMTSSRESTPRTTT